MVWIKVKPVVDVVHGDYDGKYAIDWTPYINAKWTDKVDTTITKAELQKLSKQFIPSRRF